MDNALPEETLRLVSARIAAEWGLQFSLQRGRDLQRGLAAAAEELGLGDAASCAEWLLQARPGTAQLDVLASHLTVGETYFFREKATFDVLAQEILPTIVARRRGRDRRLRLWSAGCCTGEEPYTLAILLHQLLPDLADWRITIRATDLNPRFLARAAVGSYGKWSFRAVPEAWRERYFAAEPDGRWRVRPEVARLVSFGALNLATESYPSPASDTVEMDVIFCRNVLMYFSPEQAARAIGRLRAALAVDGWLAVSPSETSQTRFAGFATRNFPGVVFYQKAEAGEAGTPGRARPPVESASGGEGMPARTLGEPPPAPSTQRALESVLEDRARARYEQGAYAEVVELLLPEAEGQPLEPRRLAWLARSLANLGRLAEALPWCDRWIAADKVDPAAHYLRAVILLERGERAGARQALHRALYLAPDFVLAHFLSAQIARDEGHADVAERHLRRVTELLQGRSAEEVLPESDGLSAGRLRAVVAAALGHPPQEPAA